VSKGLVITEKPSVATDIAEALGGFTEHEGYFESDDYVVTFAVGHLFELLEPEEVDEKYKAWTLDVLPILPDGSFQLKPKKGQSERIRTIKKLLARDDVDFLVNACDAGREGELIFREIVKYLGSDKPIHRLWLQSMTTTAIKKGFEAFLPGEDFEGLAAAAECRAYSDWLIGMNATRALTKRLASRKEKTAWSAGRVQTPTLALLVDREIEVLAHVPKPYWRVLATFEHNGSSYLGTWFDPDFEAGEDPDARDDRLFEQARAQAVVEAVSGQSGLAQETRKPSKESAPPLFDLTSLQRECNRRFGWSARRTLSAAQRCYERHKVLTYPRTDSRCLPKDYRETVTQVLDSLGAGADHGGPEFQDYARGAQSLQENGLQNEQRSFNDAGVSDHFAIIPTGTLPEQELTGDDKRVFDLVVRRFLGAFFPPALWERVERFTEVAGQRFQTKARSLTEAGWRAVLPAGSDEDSTLLAPLVPGESEVSGIGARVTEVERKDEETKPPPRISEARLLSLMENAGKQIDDEDLAAVLHEKGIGTPATRAEIFENLIRKGYVVRQGKGLRPTVKGIRLIDSLRRVDIDRLASPELTGELEQHLLEVERGDRSPERFMDEVTAYAVEVVDRAKTFEYEELYADAKELGPCPSCGRPVTEMAWFYRCPAPPRPPRLSAEEKKAKRAAERKAAKEAKAKGIELPKQEEPEDNDCPMRFWKDTAGRYLNTGAVQTLLKDGQTPVLDGFMARNGRTYRGHIEIDRDEWKLKVRSDGWNEESASDIPEYEVNSDPLAPCPLSCGSKVIETPTEFVCAAGREKELQKLPVKEAETPEERKARRKHNRELEAEKCGFILPRTVCKREIVRDEAEYYLAHGRTELLSDFTSRFGRPFAAILVLKETGRHGFEFLPRGAAAAQKSETEGDASATKATKKKAAKKKPAKKKVSKKKVSKKKAAARKKAPGVKKSTRKKAGARG